MPVLSCSLGKLTHSRKNMQLTNCVYLHDQTLKNLKISDNSLVCIDERLVTRCRIDNVLKEGILGSSSLHWESLNIKTQPIGKIVKIENWSNSKKNQNIIASTISFVVDTFSHKNTLIDAEKLACYIKDIFKKEIFCKDQKLIINWRINGENHYISLKVAKINYAENNNNNNDENDNDNEEKKEDDDIKTKKEKLKESRFGKINDNTYITLLASKNKNLQLKYSGPSPISPIFDGNLNPESMGIGGLNLQFAKIFRRAFASRLFPPNLIKELGVKHVKGMLLYGPPGTGKTLIARSISQMLTDNIPKIVNGPEILNKYVGESEENIRKLFHEAIEEQKKKGDYSGLHIIIFDEIDAICKQRGSSNSGSGVHDTVVNQLLSMIDGVNSLNNILVIGMTNRKDLLDTALLRQGRLEVHIEIGLPDELGREEIFRIHTKKLSEGGYLDKRISISELAKRTKNYTGAEIEGVVRAAISYAMRENIDPDNLDNIDTRKLSNLKVKKEYFDLALEDIKPEFGNKNEEIESGYNRGIYIFNNKIKELINFTDDFVKKMKISNNINRKSILLHGNMGCGKTALSYYLAEKSKFPFIRVLSDDDFIGVNDIEKCRQISKIFDDAYKSELSVIIIDDFERLIGYSIGPRFSQLVLQGLLSVIRKKPKNNGRKILIFVTSPLNVIKKLQIENYFDYCFEVPLINNRIELKNILIDSKYDKLCYPDINCILNSFPKKNANIGISSLLTVLELAVNDDNKITKKSFLNSYKKATQHNYNNNNNTINLNFSDDEDE